MAFSRQASSGTPKAAKGSPERRERPRRREEVFGICLTLCPRSWLPVAVPLATGAAYVRFRAKIYRCAGGRWIHDLAIPPRKITFDLYASRERGVCMNYPVNGSDAPDLWFPERPQPIRYDYDRDIAGDRPCTRDILDAGDNPPHPHHYQQATTQRRVRSASIRIRCEDFGAYGWLVASAPGCVPIPPREVLPNLIPGCPSYSPVTSDLPTDTLDVPGPVSGPCVTIPRDEAPFDHIADAATAYNGAATIDLDLRPRQTIVGGATATTNFGGAANYPVVNGDGLTGYEEYRGFMARRRPQAPAGYRAIVRAGTLNIHIRTDPRIKDVFVRDQHGMGTGYFRRLGVAVHRIRAVHYNGDYAPGDQAGPGGASPPPGLEQPDLAVPGPRVVNFNRGYATETIQHGIRLVNEPLGADAYGQSISSVGPPGTVHRVAVNVAECIADGLDVAAVIAHELGHAVAIPHHGERLDAHQARTRNVPAFLTALGTLREPVVLVPGGSVLPPVVVAAATPFATNVTSPAGLPSLPSPILNTPIVLRPDITKPVTRVPVTTFPGLGTLLAFLGYTITDVAVVDTPPVWLAVPGIPVIPRTAPGTGPVLAGAMRLAPVPLSAALAPGDLALFAGSLTKVFYCGPPGQVTSGDMDCVMRYNFEEICHQHTVSPVPPFTFTHFAARVPEGTEFCISPLGTGRNEVGRSPCDFARDANAGAAGGPGRGACRKRLRVHD